MKLGELELSLIFFSPEKETRQWIGLRGERKKGRRGRGISSRGVVRKTKTKRQR